MKHLYKGAAVLLFLGCVCKRVHAQTHFGAGVGTIGPNHAFFGTQAGASNTLNGLDNSFFGHQAGFLNSNGPHNVFVGFQAGYSNDVGTGNAYIGYKVGHNSKFGAFNTFVGGYTGENNFNGSGNLFTGYNAGWSNTLGNYNSFVGTNSGTFNTIGENNVFVGNESGYHNTEGVGNTLIGYQAGYLNETGLANVMIGLTAGYSSINTQFNSFLGSLSGYLTTGSGNSFIGYKAGYKNTSGELNTYLGHQAGGLAEIKNATAIGANAFVTASNSLVLGNTANVGIGVSAPQYQLQLSSGLAAKTGSPAWIVASDKRLKKDIFDYTDGLEILKQIKPVWFSYNGQAGIKDTRKFVGIIAQEMQKIAPYTVGAFNYQDSLGNKTEYLDYDAGALTYMLVNSVKEQQEIIDNKEAKIQGITATVTELSKRLEQLERIVASSSATPKPVGSSAAKVGEELNANGVILEQNVPNSFSQGTSIRFFIPESVKEAVINIYSTNGVKVGSYPINNRGQASLALSAKAFQSGVFIYDLVTDGKSNGTKKMVVTK